MGTMTLAKELFSKARQPMMEAMCFKMLTTIGKQIEPNQDLVHSTNAFKSSFCNPPFESGFCEFYIIRT